MSLLPRRAATAAVLTAAGLAATATPALAGGIVVVDSPSFNNGCANHKTNTRPSGATTHSEGIVGGLTGQVPAATPLNQCGGADLPKPPCMGTGKINAQSLLALVNVGVQDTPVLSAPQLPQCAGTPL